MFAWIVYFLHTRGYLSYKNILSRVKNLGVREVQICVRKLAVNTGDCAIFECAALPL